MVLFGLFIYLLNKKIQTGLDSHGTAKEYAQGKPLWIRVVNEGYLQGAKAFLDCEKEIVISGDKYQLGCLVLFDKDRQHFTSLHNINNEFIHYDGMWNKTGSHHRMVVKTDYIGPNIIVDHMLYVRTIDDESI
jgi:hypothetical protein